MAKVKANGEEFEIEEEVHPTAQHFNQPIEQIELAKKMARYHEITTELAALESLKDALRTELIQAGRGLDSIMAGEYACFYKKVQGRVSCDWKQAYKDAVGEMPEDDVTKYIKKGEESVRVEVKKLK